MAKTENENENRNPTTPCCAKHARLVREACPSHQSSVIISAPTANIVDSHFSSSSELVVVTWPNLALAVRHAKHTQTKYKKKLALEPPKQLDLYAPSHSATPFCSSFFYLSLFLSHSSIFITAILSIGVLSMVSLQVFTPVWSQRSSH
jgi:hypothetical protein